MLFKNYFINGSICPNEILASEVKNLEINEGLYAKDILIAVRLKEADSAGFKPESFAGNKIESKSESFIQVAKPYDIFSKNALLQLRKESFGHLHPVQAMTSNLIATNIKLTLLTIIWMPFH